MIRAALLACSAAAAVRINCTVAVPRRIRAGDRVAARVDVAVAGAAPRGAAGEGRAARAPMYVARTHTQVHRHMPQALRTGSAHIRLPRLSELGLTLGVAAAMQERCSDATKEHAYG